MQACSQLHCSLGSSERINRPPPFHLFFHRLDQFFPLGIELVLKTWFTNNQSLASGPNSCGASLFSSFHGLASSVLGATVEADPLHSPPPPTVTPRQQENPTPMLLPGGRKFSAAVPHRALVRHRPELRRVSRWLHREQAQRPSAGLPSSR